MPYHLNSPLPVLRVPVLLEWGREDHHRDNFSSEHGSDIPGSNFSGCFVLPYYWDFCLGRESVTTHCFLRTSQKLKGLPVFNPHPPPPPFKVKSFSFPGEILLIRMVWSFTFKEQLVSSEISEISAFSSNRCDISHFIITFQQKVSGQKVKLLISGVCPIYVWIKSLVGSKSAHSPFMLWFALWSSLSWSFQYPFWLSFGWNWVERCAPGVASDANCHSVQGARLKLTQSLKSKLSCHWNEYSMDIKSLSPTI